MSFLRFFSIFSAISVALSGLGKADAAISKESREVQMLANFPALQKLSRKNDGVLRAYLSRVSTTYREAGYRDFARELAQASSLVVLFGQPERARSSESLAKARSVLRDLKRSLNKNSFTVLPRAGQTLPDYLGIGTAFLGGADKALKNLDAHKNVANSLRNNKGMSWLTNKGDGRYTASNSFSGSLRSTDFSVPEAGSLTVSSGTLSVGNTSSLSFSGSEIAGSLYNSSSPSVSLSASELNQLNQIDLDMSKLGSGTLVLGGTNTYVGATMVTAGNLTIANSGTLSISGNELALSGSGTLTIQMTASWAIFPPSVEIPTAFGRGNPILLKSSSLIGGAEYPAGTRLIQFDGSSDLLPEGAALFTTPATISAVPTPTPAPTPSGT